MELPATPSIGLEIGFVLLALAAASAFAWVSKRWALTAAWLVLTAGLALTGFFQIIGPPPVLPIFLATSLIAGGIFAWRSDFHKFSFRLLVGFQAFRIVVETLIHQAVLEGVAPPQFTWTGLNWDILSGISALMLLPFANKLPHWSIRLWNFLGLALLANIIIVGTLSMPTPFQQLEPTNIWIMHFPFIWLPVIAVMLALIGHIALAKKLALARKT